MANVGTKFVRLQSVKVTSEVNEIILLRPGVAGKQFNGDLDFGANSLKVGDTIRISAWGTFTGPATDRQAGRVQVRLYFPAVSLINRRADTGVIRLPSGIDVEWHFLAQITIKETGKKGLCWCDSYLHNVTQPGSGLAIFNRMAGLGAFRIDTTVANSLDLTAEVTGVAPVSFILNQCSVELLPSP